MVIHAHQGTRNVQRVVGGTWMLSRDKSGALGNVLGKREKAQRNKIPAVSWSPGRNSVKPSRRSEGEGLAEGSEGHAEN